MGKSATAGCRVRGGKIQIEFREKGRKKRTYKTLDPRLYPNTQAGLIAAKKLRDQIVFEIKHDIYNPGKYWSEGEAFTGSFSEWAQRWLDLPEHNWSYNTRRKYKSLLQNQWMPYFHAWDMRSIEFQDLHEALISMKAVNYSASYYNDILVVIRGVMGLHAKSMRCENPAEDLNNKKRVSDEPEPFTMEEAGKIIEFARGENWGEWFKIGFFTGLRCPGEMLGLRRIDIQGNQLKVRRQRLHNGEIQEFTKTKRARTVNLNAIAKQALDSLEGDDYLFPVRSNKSQMKTWKRALEALELHPRPMYNMRHTFATFCLMSGQNPAYTASQMGHSIEEFFRTYAKWINTLMDDKQASILDKAISENKHADALRIQPKMVVDNTK